MQAIILAMIASCFVEVAGVADSLAATASTDVLVALSATAKVESVAGVTDSDSAAVFWPFVNT